MELANESLITIVGLKPHKLPVTTRIVTYCSDTLTN